MKSYKTLKSEGEDRFVVKKSTFIGYAGPVTTQDEALAFIASVKSKHWDATHNVYAYILSDGNTARYSDDGEPQGTAGIPVLDVLKKEELTNLVVVATRYFGGIMLGAGGLVRAYSHTAKIAVDAAGIITMCECAVCELVSDYNMYGRILPAVHASGAKISGTDFGADVRMVFTIPLESLNSFSESITDLSNGKVFVKKIGETFCEI